MALSTNQDDKQGRVVATASSKGGVGKSTFVMALASAFAKNGLNVGILDNDPNQPIIEWVSENPITGITVYPKVEDNDVLDTIDGLRSRHDIVLADMEGSANLGVAMAIASADLVLIPSQGSGMDDKEAAKTLNLIRNQSKLARREIPYRIVFTRTNPAITPRSLKRAYERLLARGIPHMKAEFTNLDAFKLFVDEGKSLYDLSKEEAPNLNGALKTLHNLTSEVVAILSDPQHGIEPKAPTKDERKEEAANG